MAKTFRDLKRGEQVFYIEESNEKHGGLMSFGITKDIDRTEGVTLVEENKETYTKFDNPYISIRDTRVAEKHLDKNKFSCNVEHETTIKRFFLDVKDYVVALKGRTEHYIEFYENLLEEIKEVLDDLK